MIVPSKFQKWVPFGETIGFDMEATLFVLSKKDSKKFIEKVEINVAIKHLSYIPIVKLFARF